MGIIGAIKGVSLAILSNGSATAFAAPRIAEEIE